eukprot:COSAG06_NODE_11961_length_1441_cov_6.364382_2_plen_263_part_00
MDHATRERPLARLLASVSAPLLTCLHAERPSNNVGLGAKLTIARSPSYSYRSLCLIKSSAKMGTSTMMMPSHRRLFSRMNSALRAATNASTSRTTAAAAAAAAAENADDATADDVDVVDDADDADDVAAAGAAADAVDDADGADGALLALLATHTSLVDTGATTAAAAADDVPAAWPRRTFPLTTRRVPSSPDSSVDESRDRSPALVRKGSRGEPGLPAGERRRDERSTEPAVSRVLTSTGRPEWLLAHAYLRPCPWPSVIS